MFVFLGTGPQLRALLDALAALIRPAEDVVQAWPVPAGADPEEFARGAVRPVRPVAVVLGRGRPLFVNPAVSPTDPSPQTEEP